MRLVVSGGGTGGHVYPALAVLELLLQNGPVDGAEPSAADLLWIGSQDGIEAELIQKAGLQFEGLPVGGVRGKSLGEGLRNSVQIATGVRSARELLARFRPEVVLVTGGYVCVAVTLAAWLERVPVLIYLPDIEPGLAIRFLSRLAARVAVTCEESVKFFPAHKVVVTGYPVRSELFRLNRTEAKQALHLDSDSKTLLVFGGSRGARSINQALVAGLPRLLDACQVVHVSGRLDADQVAETTKSLPERMKARYHRHAYLHDMPQALVAADLAVARAGAATLGEFPAAGLPAVLVPYPYSGRHQDANADHLARHGAARIIGDAQLSEQLVPAVLGLLDDETTLAKMQRACKALARPDAARSIAQQLRYLARKGGTREAGTKQ